MSTVKVLRDLWLGAGLPVEHLTQARISLLQADKHVLRSSFRIGVAAQACIAATTLAASLLHHLTLGTELDVQVDARHAALEFASERYSRLLRKGQSNEEAVHASDPRFKQMLGLSPNELTDWDPLAGYYSCAHGRYIRLHTNWRHHKIGLLKILGLNEEANRDNVASALREWEAEDFETAARESGMCATMCRSAKEWKETEVAQSVQSWLDDNHGCPVKLTKSKSSSKSAPSTKDLATRSLRVVDMSRVIAAPVAGRTLSNHGADVLLVSCLRLPRLPMFEIDTARGKRAAAIDLDQEQGSQILSNLIKEADVLLQAYRPGALAKRGFSFEDLQQLRPGLIYAELCAYGFTGPWKDVRGFDSLVQSASGINTSESESYNQFLSASGQSDETGPRVLPCQALDHATGYLLAFGILAARCRSILESNSKEDGWHVQVSLAGTANWLESLGRVHGAEAWQDPQPIDHNSKEVQDLLQDYSVRGSVEPLTLYSIQHAGRPIATQKRSVPVRLDADVPKWA